MGYDIGTARGVIELGYNGRGIKEAQTDLDRTGKKGGDVQGIMKKTSTGFLVAGTAIAGGLALGINAAANFEQRMSAIGAVSGATKGELEQLSKKALQLGKDTQFSASESASAMEELIKAGLSVEDVLNGAADATVNLAAAGAVDMPTAATISANAMNQFGLAAKDMNNVVDLIAGAANASAIDVTDFGMSLSQVGAVAHLAGVSFDDTATAIALMGNAGIKGSDAGTSLKSMFMRLQPTTKKQSELMKELGLITKDGSNQFYTAEGKTKSLAQVSGVLSKALAGMSQKQKQAALSTLFGSDAIRGAAVLADQGSAGFNKMSKAMGKVSAADVAAKRMDNFKGSVEQLKGSVETVGIAMGSVFLPMLRQVVDALGVAVNAFLSLSAGQQKGIAISLAALAAFLLIVGGIMKMIIFVSKFVKALQVLRLAFATTWVAALGPIALIIAAIVLVGIALFVLWKKSETFRDIVKGVWNAIKAAAMAVANWFTGPFVNFFVSAWDAIVSGLQAVGGFFMAIWNGIKAGISAVFAAIGAVITFYINFWKTIITTGLAIIGAVWNAFWGVFGGLITAVFGLIVAIIQLYLTIMKLIIMSAWVAIKAITSAVWNGIMAVLRAVWSGIVAVVRTYINIVRAIISAVWGAIRAVTSAVWNGIKAVINAVWGVIGGRVRAGANAVKSVISAAWNAARATTVRVWNAVAAAVSNAIGKLMGHVRSIKGKVTGALSGAASWLYNSGKAIVQGLINGITSMIHKVTSAIHALTSKIAAAVPGSPVKTGPLKVLNRGHAGKQIVQMLIDGIDVMRPALASAMDANLGAATPTAPILPASTPKAPAATASGATGALRLLSGELSIDESGRAFITGVAVDVGEDADDYNDTLSRMGTR